MHENRHPSITDARHLCALRLDNRGRNRVEGKLSGLAVALLLLASSIPLLAEMQPNATATAGVSSTQYPHGCTSTQYPGGGGHCVLEPGETATFQAIYTYQSGCQSGCPTVSVNFAIEARPPNIALFPSAASWVTPQSIGVASVVSGASAVGDFSIAIPSNQTLGYYVFVVVITVTHIDPNGEPHVGLKADMDTLVEVGTPTTTSISSSSTTSTTSSSTTRTSSSTTSTSFCESYNVNPGALPMSGPEVNTGTLFSMSTSYLTRNGATQAIAPGTLGQVKLQPGDVVTTETGYVSLTYDLPHSTIDIGKGTSLLIPIIYDPSNQMVDVASSTMLVYRVGAAPCSLTADVYQSSYSLVTVQHNCNMLNINSCIDQVTANAADCASNAAACSGDPGFSLHVAEGGTLLRVYRGSLTFQDNSTGQSLIVSAGNQVYVSGSEQAAMSPINDVTPPTATGFYPNSVSDQVTSASPISVGFSEPIYPLSVTGSNFSIRSATGGQVGGTWEALGETVVFIPVEPIPAGTYNVTVKGGTGGVSDLSGNVLPSDYTFTFTLGSAGWAPSIMIPVAAAVVSVVIVGIVVTATVRRRKTSGRQ